MKKQHKSIPETPGSSGVAPKVSTSTLLTPALFLVVFLYFWFAPTIALQDPWWDAAALMNSADAEQDPAKRQKILEESRAELKKLAEIHPYHARVHFLVAVSETRTGQFDSAIKHAREAIRLGSGSIVNRVDVVARQILVEATTRKAQDFINKNDYETALAVLRESYSDAPTDKGLLLGLGKVSMLKKDADSAQGYLDAALKADPQSAEVHMVLGDLARSLGQTSKAIEYLERAIALDPKLTAAKTLLETVKQSPQNHD